MPSLKLRLISATHKLPWNRSPQALISLRAKPSKSKWTIYNTFSGAASAIEEDSSFDTRLVKRELILWLKKERYPWEHEMHYCHLVTAQMRSPGVAWCSWTQDTPQQWDRWPMTRSLQRARGRDMAFIQNMKCQVGWVPASRRPSSWVGGGSWNFVITVCSTW